MILAGYQTGLYAGTEFTVLEGIQNIHGDPLFLNNLRLAVNSPAINSGDPSLPDDPDGSPPDMGAYPFDQGNICSESIT